MENKNTDKKTSSKFDPDQFGKDLLYFVRDIAVAMISVFLIFHFLVRPVEIIGSSMYPTLQDREYGIANVLGVKLNHIERFDIVIIYVESKNEYIVKRVVGLPGETIAYKEGKLYVDGNYIEEPFLDQDYVSSFSEGSFMSDVSEITLASDEYFCLGDNRPHSSDSRYYGPFKKEDIVAKGVTVIFPFNKIGVKSW